MKVCFAVPLSAAIVFVAVLATTSLAEVLPPRTLSYGTVMQGNIAAENTTADLLTRQFLISDQFVAGEYGANGSSGNASLSFKGMGLNWFGSAEATSSTVSGHNSAEILAGLGVSNLFGAGIVFDLADESMKSGDNSVSTGYAPAGIGLVGSFNIGFGGVYARAKINSFPDYSRKTEIGGTTLTEMNTRTEIVAGWIRNPAGEKIHCLGADVTLAIEGHTTESGGTKAVDNGRMTVGAAGHYGIALVSNDNFSVVVGSDAGVEISSFENRITNANPKETSSTNIWIRPNVALQKVLGKGFEAQVGASARILDWDLGSSTNSADTETKTGSVYTRYNNVLLGLSWVHENLRVEGRLSPLLLTNGPNIISGTVSPMFASLGVTLGY